jgi:hypothetical protein
MVVEDQRIAGQEPQVEGRLAERAYSDPAGYGNAALAGANDGIDHDRVAQHPDRRLDVADIDAHGNDTGIAVVQRKLSGQDGSIQRAGNPEVAASLPADIAEVIAELRHHVERQTVSVDIERDLAVGRKA